MIDAVELTPLSDREFGFMRQALRPDIAGFVITNTDPEGIAVDNLRFGAVPQLG